MTAGLALASAIEPADAPIYGTEFIREMLRQTRALDSYGQWDGKPVPTILAGYVLSKEQKRALPTIGDPDELTLARVKAFHNAIAVLIEKECGQMAVPFVQITHEGFGRALITVGKLVVMDRTLRDVHRFGFESLSKMKSEADKHLAGAQVCRGDRVARERAGKPGCLLQIVNAVGEHARGDDDEKAACPGEEDAEVDAQHAAVQQHAYCGCDRDAQPSTARP